MIGGAVLLVDDDGVASILHGEILEMQIRDLHGAGGRRPCLDPDAVLRVDEGAAGDEDPRHVFLIGVLPQAADADPVAWPAGDVLDVHLRELVSHGDAVVSRGNHRVRDVHHVGTRHVDPVRVGAVPGGGYREPDEGDVHAGYAVDVEVLAVLGGDVANDGVVDEIEAQVLHQIYVYIYLIRR